MHLDRAEFVDHIPGQRSVALLQHGDEAILLLRKGEVSEQAGTELTELLQQILNPGEGGHDWPPNPSVN